MQNMRQNVLNEAETIFVLIAFNGVLCHVRTYTVNHFFRSLYMNQIKNKTLLSPWLNNTEVYFTTFLVLKITQLHDKYIFTSLRLNFSDSYTFFTRKCNMYASDYDVRFVLDQHAKLDLYCSSSLNQQSAGRLVAPLTHFFSDFELTILCSHSLKLRA
jgi:hypothetical protein